MRKTQIPEKMPAPEPDAFEQALRNVWQEQEVPAELDAVILNAAAERAFKARLRQGQPAWGRWAKAAALFAVGAATVLGVVLRDTAEVAALDRAVGQSAQQAGTDTLKVAEAALEKASLQEYGWERFDEKLWVLEADVVMAAPKRLAAKEDLLGFLE